MESFPKCDFIPVDYYEVRHVKSSFKKLMRACVPSSPFNENERGFLKAMEETEWLPQVGIFHYGKFLVKAMEETEWLPQVGIFHYGKFLVKAMEETEWLPQVGIFHYGKFLFIIRKNNHLR